MQYEEKAPIPVKPSHFGDHRGGHVSHRDPLHALGTTTLAANRWSPPSHAATRPRATHFQLSRVGRSLLGLQRQYGNHYVQRVLALARQGEGEAEAPPEVESGIERARGSGHALDHGVQRQMESAFGADFSGVRVHTGAKAHSLNQAVNAIAFTTGQDIFFRQGEYNPGSSAGRELLAHELTHVVQQGGAPAASGQTQRVAIQRMCPACEEKRNKIGAIQGKLVVGTADDQYEQEADRVVKAVVTTIDSGTHSANEFSATSAPLTVHRQCACGGHSNSNGECAECRRRPEAASQGKAEVVQRYALLTSRTLVQRDPFDPTGPDNSSCRDKITEDGARCADHANTMCSVTGGGLGGSAALVGAGIGTMIFPGVGTLIGGAAGLLGGAIGGAVIYGKCVERMNAACRARTAQGLKVCDQKFPPVVGVSNQGQIPEVNVEDLPKASAAIPEVNVEDLPKAE